jgi:hypothetical protein
MVGLTMLLAITILVFGAAGLFAWLSRPFSDLIPIVAPAVEPAPESEPPGVAVAVETPEPVDIAAPEAPTVTSAAAVPTDDFTPTHQIGATQSVNFRAGPTTSDAIIITLPPATALEYLDEDAPTTSSQDGERWMRFRTEQGEEGWVREIDTAPYQP